MRPKLRVLSLGGGTQSSALALMSARGELPKLDHVIFADTQNELPETYNFIQNILQPELAASGIPLHSVTKGNLRNCVLGIEQTGSYPTLPVRVRRPDGKEGRIGQYRCSYHFKRKMIERQIKSLCGGHGDWKRTDVEQWIGFSIDEAGRMKESNACRCGHTYKMHTTPTRECRGKGCKCDGFDRWLVNRWPLIDLGMKREDTIQWFIDHGYPTPTRSACWFCPNNSNDRWRSIAETHPDLFDLACDLDQSIRNGGEFPGASGNSFEGEMFLHSSLKPLREALSSEEDDDVLDPLAWDCQIGNCFT